MESGNIENSRDLTGARLHNPRPAIRKARLGIEEVLSSWLTPTTLNRTSKKDHEVLYTSRVVLATNRAWPVKSNVPRKHVLQWVVEPVETEPSLLQKHMFGCQGIYLFGRLVFVLAARAEPWGGLLVCTSREFHSSLIYEYPCLRPHPVLGKWLYLPQSDETFEENAPKLVLQALENDPRIGVEPDESVRKRA